MSDKPLVSLLIPICNVEKYLRECLDSARDQTLKNIEIICINDGSTDSSLDIIKEYAAADSRFIVIDKLNSGYGDSMNKGLDLAAGKYVAILESDDFMDLDALEYMVDRCEADSLDLLKCNFWLYWSNPDRDLLYRHNWYFMAVSPEMELMGVHNPVDTPEIFWAKPSIWSVLYRRSFLNENNIRFLPTPGASFQDTSFSFKAFSQAKRFACSSRAFVHYRQDNEKSSVNNPGKVFCVCDEHEEIARFLTEDRPDLKPELNAIRAKMKFYNYHWNLLRLACPLKFEFLPRYSQEMRAEFESDAIVTVAEGEGVRYAFSKEEYRDAHDIAYNPRYYGVQFACEDTNKLGTLFNYFKVGGLKYVAKVIVEKMLH